MRPKIICHMVSSIDGRLLVDRWTPPAVGIPSDLVSRHYEEVGARLEADGWIVGRATMEEMIEAPASAGEAPADGNLRTTYVAERNGRDIAVAIDPQGKIHYGESQVGGDHLVAVLGEHVSDRYLAELRARGLSYLFAGPDGHDLSRALEILGADFGAKTLLLEGGGRINGAFLKARLIDEISLLIHPGIDGLAGVPSVFGYVGGADEKPAAGQSLRLLSAEPLDGGVVWLRYQVENAPN